jgi:hypothetical protein
MYSERTFIDVPEHLPLPPKYESPCNAPDSRFFANGDSFTDRERLPGFNPKFVVEHERKNECDFLVVYGRVAYTDTFTGGRDGEVIIHETRWCYLYRGPQDDFVPCGPIQYNGHRDRREGQQKAN